MKVFLKNQFKSTLRNRSTKFIFKLQFIDTSNLQQVQTDCVSVSLKLLNFSISLTCEGFKMCSQNVTLRYCFMQNVPHFAIEQTLTLRVLIFDAFRRNLSSELYSPYL